MAKGPLYSTQRHERAVMLMEAHAQLGESHMMTCWRYVEFEQLCKRYAGDPVDLEPLVKRAKEAISDTSLRFVQRYLEAVERRWPDQPDAA